MSTSVSALSFFVAGVPVPQGSMKAITLKGKKFTQLISDNDATLKPWRSKVVDVATLARNLAGWPENYNGAVELSCRCLLPMPATRPSAIRRAAIGLRTVKPDLDKLMRAIGDALTIANVVDDDARIVIAHLAKYEVSEHNLCGVEVVVHMYEDKGAADLLLERRRASFPALKVR